MAARVGPGWPYEATFLVEDNFGDQQYGNGKIMKASFYVQYNDVHFGHSEINQKLGRNDFWFQDRNDANLVSPVLPDDNSQRLPSRMSAPSKKANRFIVVFFEEGRHRIRGQIDFRRPPGKQ